MSNLKADDTFKALVSAGVVSITVANYHDINSRLEEKTARRKKTLKRIIVAEVAEEFRVEMTTVYRARALMNKSVSVKFAEKRQKPDEGKP